MGSKPQSRIAKYDPIRYNNITSRTI